MLTVDQVSKALPANLKGAATQQLVDQINNIVSDPLVAEQVRNNFISYTSVLRDGKYKTEDYLHAVTYVSFKLMNMSNGDAWAKTFPAKYQALVARGVPAKDIGSHVHSFSKGKLVNAVLEQTLVPSWVLNQHLYQDALNVQATLMTSSQSDMVRTTAANSILNALQKPKEAGPLINFDMRESSGMNEMKDLLTRMAQQQITLMESGVSVSDIAGQKIMDVEAKEI